MDRLGKKDCKRHSLLPNVLEMPNDFGHFTSPNVVYMGSSKEYCKSPEIFERLQQKNQARVFQFTHGSEQFDQQPQRVRFDKFDCDYPRQNSRCKSNSFSNQIPTPIATELRTILTELRVMTDKIREEVFRSVKLGFYKYNNN